MLPGTTTSSTSYMARMKAKDESLADHVCEENEDDERLMSGSASSAMSKCRL